jgi:3',5'-cyclic-AMP phosphodiesterase
MKVNMKKVLIAVLGAVAICAVDWVRFYETAPAAEKGYSHIAVLSDLHLPGRILQQKEKAIDTLNTWSDLDMIVVLGDICEDHGSVEEYAFAKRFLGKLKKPFFPIVGNHEYIYYDINPFNPKEKIAKGKHVVAASGTARRTKLERFKETFALPEIYYTKRVDPYLLVFLSIDHLYVSYRTALSDTQLDWLRAELGKNRGIPTIIFFHGPLEGTIGGENLVDNDPVNYMVQPYREIRKILVENPQVFLWVSGHAHIAPTNANFSHPINLYERRVMNIHNPDMNGSSYLSEKDQKGKKHEDIWTNSLFLYPDRVVVKTYDHEKMAWMESLTREIKAPRTQSR